MVLRCVLINRDFTTIPARAKACGYRYHSISWLTVPLQKIQAFAIFLSICIAICVAGCSSPVTNSGSLENDEVWKGRIVLKGDIVVPENVTLTIEPGATITVPGRKPDKDIQMYRDIGGRTVNLFNEDKVDLIIRGTLIARGTESRPIVIDGRKTGRFGTVSLLGDENSSVLEYVAIRNGLLGLRCYDRRSPKVSNCEFSGHSIGGIGGIGLWDFSSPEIKSCLIKNNKYGLGASDLCKPIISDNDVQDNTASGIFAEGGSSAIIANNRVTGNNVGIATGDEAKPLIENNHLEGNGGAIGCWKESSPRIVKNVIVKNMGAVVISGSSSPEILKNKFIDNGGGIACTERSRVVLSENEIKRNVRGVILSGSARATLKQNLLESNEVGVFVSNNARVQMESNKFLECEVGVQLEDNARMEETGTIYRGNQRNIIDKRKS